MTVQAIYYGKAEDMIAEVSAFDMGDEYRKENNYRYLVMPLGEAQYDTEHTTTLADAKAIAREYAKLCGVKMVRV